MSIAGKLAARRSQPYCNARAELLVNNRSETRKATVNRHKPKLIFSLCSFVMNLKREERDEIDQKETFPNRLMM